MGAVILARVMDSNIDIVLVEVSELTACINQLNDSNEYEKYDHIFITDLPVRPDAIQTLNSNPSFNQKIIHFDHHTSELKDNIPPYLGVIPEKDGKKHRELSYYMITS